MKSCSALTINKTYLIVKQMTENLLWKVAVLWRLKTKYLKAKEMTENLLCTVAVLCRLKKGTLKQNK